MNPSELLALIDDYHITDKRLLRARAALADKPDERTRREFRKQALRYFSNVAAEAKQQLADVDRRLDDVYQRQYNLHAERAVAERRLQGAVAVTQALETEA
ncbi:MAG TPA: hypothetical protein VEJ41_06870 [Candidatus Acidoferrales bacterium]|nr:hypothetical protein [Candidatus Acidoferrales bacterium]